MLGEHDIVEMLQLRGTDQEQLFEAARDQRRAVFGDEVVVRGVTEIANRCRVNCQFCPMRRENTRHNDNFRMTPDDLVDAARTVHANDIDVVFFQGGEISQTTRVVGEALPRIRELYDGNVEILLNLGNKPHDEYAYLRDQGATSYILKHETSDPRLNEEMRFETLESRLDRMRDLLDLGYWVGTGAIIGLPGQTLASIARDILLARDIGAHMCSVSPFVPAPDTPLADHPPGDLDVSVNAIAASRLVRPDWLIPSVSALAKTQHGGQFRGFTAGANVMTVNFTPNEQRDRYLIYGKDRFVVRRDYATDLIASTGLRPGKSVFVGRTPARRREPIS
jgi:biotin synthase